MMEDAVVNCGSCAACCNQIVFLMPGDDPSLFDLAEVVDAPNPVSGETVTHFLPFANGKCGMLIDGKCSIYEKRPVTCRAFDCAGWVRLTMSRTTRAQRRHEMGRTIDPEIWAAGRKRLSA